MTALLPPCGRRVVGTMVIVFSGSFEAVHRMKVGEQARSDAAHFCTRFSCCFAQQEINGDDVHNHVRSPFG